MVRAARPTSCEETSRRRSGTRSSLPFYAFLLLIDEATSEGGFTLANHYVGDYPDGHGIRRDGDGVFPPVAADPARHFRDAANAFAWASARFPSDFEARSAIPPGTNGYPDVDTWRDLSFWVEATPSDWAGGVRVPGGSGIASTVWSRR